MSALSRLLERHPFVSSIVGVVVGVVVVGNAAFALIQVLANVLGLDRVVAIAIGDGTSKAISALVFFLILRHQGWTSLVGFNGPSRWTQAWLIMGVHALIIAANAVTNGLLVRRVPTDSDIRLNALVSTAATLPLLFYGLYLLRDITRLDLSPPHLPRSWSSKSNTASATASG